MSPSSQLLLFKWEISTFKMCTVSFSYGNPYTRVPSHTAPQREKYSPNEFSVLDQPFQVCHGLNRSAEVWNKTYGTELIIHRARCQNQWCVLPWCLTRSELSTIDILWVEKRSHSSRTMLRLTNHATQWRICLNVHLLLSRRGYGHPQPRLHPVDYEVWVVMQTSLPYYDQQCRPPRASSCW